MDTLRPFAELPEAEVVTPSSECSLRHRGSGFELLHNGDLVDLFDDPRLFDDPEPEYEIPTPKTRVK